MLAEAIELHITLGLAAGLVFRVTSDRTEADRYLTVEDKLCRRDLFVKPGLLLKVVMPMSFYSSASLAANPLLAVTAFCPVTR